MRKAFHLPRRLSGRPRIWYVVSGGRRPDRPRRFSASCYDNASKQRLEIRRGQHWFRWLGRALWNSRLEGQGLSENTFDPGDVDKMVQRLEALRTRHRELDELISQLEADGGQDIRIMGLKRDKLRTKDHIAWLASKLTPDIIA